LTWQAILLLSKNWDGEQNCFYLRKFTSKVCWLFSPKIISGGHSDFFPKLLTWPATLIFSQKIDIASKTVFILKKLTSKACWFFSPKIISWGHSDFFPKLLTWPAMLIFSQKIELTWQANFFIFPKIDMASEKINLASHPSFSRKIYIASIVVFI